MKTIVPKYHLAGLVLAAGLALPVVAQAQLCTAGTAQAEVESGNIKTTVLNGGDMFWNLNDARFEVPKGSGKHSIFAGAVWFGGMATGHDLHLSTQTYRQAIGGPADAGFWPGPLDANGQIAAPGCSAFDFIAKVNKSVIDNFLTHTFPVDQADVPQEILMWPAKGNPFRSDISNMGAGNLAPFMDVDNNGYYDPRMGDYPLIPGDQAVYMILNDAGGIKEPVSPAVGMEMHVMLYGFNSPASTDVQNTIFARYTLINRGNKTLNDAYFGKWVDFDLGYYLDDFVGSDSTRNMFYTYNADNNDEGTAGYGANPPAQGVIFLNVPMTNFMTYSNTASPVNGNPTEAMDFYNYMRGYWGNGNAITYGGNGIGGSVSTKYMYSGDPVAGTGWTELSAGNMASDTRGLGAHGPFTFAPGDVKVFDLAFPFAQGTSSINSVAQLQQAATSIQSFFNNEVMASPGNTADKALSVQLHPNPTRGNVTVQCAGSATAATFTVLDLTGRTVLQTNAQLPAGPAQHQLNLEQVPQGMYLLRVQRGELTQTVRVVKQ